MATDRLLDHLGVPKDPIPLGLRDRGHGWPGVMQARSHNTAGAELASPMPPACARSCNPNDAGAAVSAPTMLTRLLMFRFDPWGPARRRAGRGPINGRGVHACRATACPGRHCGGGAYGQAQAQSPSAI